MAEPTFNKFDAIKFLFYARISHGMQHLVLFALIMRAHQNDGFSCFPRYSTIARDIGRNEGYARDTVRELERQGLVRRSYSNGRSNTFHIQIEKLKQLADENIALDQMERDYQGPLIPEDAYTRPADFEEPSDEGKTVTVPDVDTIEDLVEYLRYYWPESACFASTEATRAFSSELQGCVSKAGSPERLGHLLQLVREQNNKAFQKAGAADAPGRYLLTCLPGWLATYQDDLIEA